MKTSTAVNLHALIGLAQAASGYFIEPLWGQVLVQMALVVCQGITAWRNSITDEKGNPIAAL